MKILLAAINSKYIHSNLAVYSLKAYYEEHTAYTPCVEIAEYTINQYTDDILQGIYEAKPDVAAFSCYLWNIEYIYEITAELKKVLPDIDIWLGGPEVTYESEKVLEIHPQLKGIMIGEGEQIFYEICEYYQGNFKECKKLTDIKGIVFRDKGVSKQLVKTPLRPLLDMNTLPFVYKDMSPFDNKIIYYESSRGCPYGCSYCLSSVEKSVRFRDLELVCKEIQYFLDIKVSQIKFVDRTFNCSHERTIALFKYILEHDNGITNFHFEIAADLLNDKELELLSQMRAGLVQLEIGVQSANELTINEIDRVMNINHLSEVVAKINNSHNVHQHLDLIAGLPYENLQSFKNSFNVVYAMQPEQLQLGFLKVLKGSKMYHNAENYGLVYKDKPPYEVLYTKWIAYDEILQLKKVEQMVELYYNSRQYVCAVNYLVDFFDTPYDMFNYLACFYDENHYFEGKHTRITRYTILYNAAEQYLDKTDLQKFTSLLIYDLFLRENLKTRPAFSISIEPLKNTIRTLYNLTGASKTAHIEPFLKGMADETDISERVQIQLQNICADNFDKYDWLLFDYENREPLNYNAGVKRIIRV